MDDDEAGKISFKNLKLISVLDDVAAAPLVLWSSSR